VNNNRAGNDSDYNVEELLMLFEEGYRVIEDAYDGFVSNGAHQEVEMHFIKEEKGE
jgi:hypothetical protein